MKQVSDRRLSDLSQTTQLVGEIWPKSFHCQFILFYSFYFFLATASVILLIRKLPVGTRSYWKSAWTKWNDLGFVERQFQVSTTWVTCTTGALRAISVKVSLRSRVQIMWARGGVFQPGQKGVKGMETGRLLIFYMPQFPRTHWDDISKMT